MVVIAMIGAATCSSSSEDSAGNEEPGIEVTGAVTGDVSTETLPDARLTVRDSRIEPATEAVRVTTTGRVDGEVEIWIPAPGLVVGDDEVLIALTSPRLGRRVELLPAELRDGTVVITTTHLSLFQGFLVPFEHLRDVLEEAVEGLTSQVAAEAEPPSCEGEDDARTEGYDIRSSSGDAVFWCFGSDDTGRFLRVVNNRRYPVLISRGRDATVVEEAPAGLDIIQRLSRVLTLSNQVTVAPRDAVTFGVDLDPDRSVRLRSEFDGVGYSLAQLEYGVELLVTILNRFGAGPRPGSPEARSVLVELLERRPCVEALGEGNPGSIVAGCFDFDMMRSTFGLAGATLLAPIITATSLLSFFRSALNAFGDVVRQRDEYAIRVIRAANSHGGLDLETCRQSTPVIGDTAVFELGARCFYEAWRAGDRELAAQFADPPAVEAMFAFTPGRAWDFVGCFEDQAHAGTWLGWTCRFIEPDPGADHGVGIILTFVAYDDVVVVSNLTTQG